MNKEVKKMNENHLCNCPCIYCEERREEFGLLKLGDKVKYVGNNSKFRDRVWKVVGLYYKPDLSKWILLKSIGLEWGLRQLSWYRSYNRKFISLESGLKENALLLGTRPESAVII